MKKRLQAFYDETVRSLEFFAAQDKVVTIDGARPEAEVYQDVLKAISQ